MADLTECKSCGYKLRKNSNRTIKSITISITSLDDHWVRVLYVKEDVPLCNVCIDDIVYSTKIFLEE